MDVSRDSESEMVAVCGALQTKAMIQSDQLVVANSLLSDWREGQFGKQDDGSECETVWSEEEGNEVSEMSLENRELWESFLNTSDHYNPLQFFTKVKTSGNDEHHEAEEEKEVESVPPSLQVKGIPECSEEEDSDWSEEDVSEMSSENRELWEFFMNNSDPYSLLHISCSTKVKTPDNDHAGDEKEEEEESEEELEEESESVCPGSQKKDNTEWSEKEESDWSNEGLSEIEDFKLKVKLKGSEIQQNPTPLRPTASEDDEQPGQSTKKPAKKVRFSEQVTIHTLQPWGADSRAARDGSCWMEMARDRDRFKRRVNQAEEIISTCFTAQHRAKVITSLLNHSESSSLVTDCQKTLFSFILAAIFVKIFFCTAVVFTAIH